MGVKSQLLRLLFVRTPGQSTSTLTSRLKLAAVRYDECPHKAASFHRRPKIGRSNYVTSTVDRKVTERVYIYVDRQYANTVITVTPNNAPGGLPGTGSVYGGTNCEHQRLQACKFSLSNHCKVLTVCWPPQGHKIN